MNILDKANEIVNERNEEKERLYGPFGEGMEICAKIASLIRNKDFDAEDAFAMLIALKFSREHYNHKEDNLLDAVAYIGAWNNYINDNMGEVMREVEQDTIPGLMEEVDKLNNNLNE
jgi:hypothetical protein